MKLKVNRFRTRRPDPVAPPEPVPEVRPAGRIGDDAFFPSESDDGFGDQSFLPPDAGRPDPLKSIVKDMVQNQGTEIARPADGSPPMELDAIRREGLTGRQLRLARRMAQKHGLPATSDFDAVRLLRKAGIDPFQKSAILELVSSDGDPVDEAGANADRALAAPPDSRALTVPNREPARLPQTFKPAPLPSTEVRVEETHVAEVRRIQADIVARRRRRLALLWAKIATFVLLPTLIAGWYYFMVATPMYATKSEFVIQQSTATSAISSMFTGTAFATSQDSVVVQGYLQSPDVMERLDQDLGFRKHFSDPGIDPVQRLDANATNTAAYALFKRYVKISYDPTEGVIKMEVSAASPQKSVEFSRALIGYAEEQVDNLTKRLRGDQEKSAADSFADAQAKLTAAQAHLVELQEKFKTLNSEVEAGLVTSQIGALQSQLTQEQLSLAQMKANPQPNQARMDPVIQRIATLEEQIAKLREGLTEDGSTGPSIASVQSELAIAQSEVLTRQLMLSQATTAMETARIEANRQTRYLSVSVEPVPPDDPSYPRAFESTLVVMLIFAGIYLMISMTIAILREQVSG